jgi:sortase A
MRFSNPQILFEQIALLFASFVWAAIILMLFVIFWAYQDVQARWDYVVNTPPEALAQTLPPTSTPSPTAWAGPGSTSTPTATQPSTPVATRVIAPPDILPETYTNAEPTPELVTNVDVPVAPVSNPGPDPAGEDIALAPPPDSPPAVPAVGLPSRLVINSVGIDSGVTPVGWSVVQKDGREFSIWQVADYAVGWHKTSAPLGQPGNTVMAGHNNVNGEVFRDLVNVEIGDRVVVYADYQKFEYEITFKTIVKEKGEPIEVRKRNAQWIAETDDERLTMVTCWPYTSNTHRVIVVAEPVNGAY